MITKDFWTGAQVERLCALNRKHSQAEVAKLMGVTVSSVRRMVAYLGLKRKCGGRAVILTQDEIQWLRDNYAETANEEIMAHLDIKWSTLHRFARAYGLKKSKEFMHSYQIKNAQLARIVNEHNDWPPKGYQIPNRNRFPKGVTNLMRLGPEREAERIRKMKETRKATIASERRRILFGFEQRTKLKLNGRFRSKTNLRYNMRKLGYIIERCGQTATITSETRRSEHYEKRCKEVGISLIYSVEYYDNEQTSTQSILRRL